MNLKSSVIGWEKLTPPSFAEGPVHFGMLRPTHCRDKKKLSFGMGSDIFMMWGDGDKTSPSDFMQTRTSGVRRMRGQ